MRWTSIWPQLPWKLIPVRLVFYLSFTFGWPSFSQPVWPRQSVTNVCGSTLWHLFKDTPAYWKRERFVRIKMKRRAPRGGSSVNWPCGQLHQHVLRSHRAAQYACTLLGYTLQKGGAAAELHRTVGQLEAHMSLTRKCEYSSKLEIFCKRQTGRLTCVWVQQCCVWETLWRRWRPPRGPSTFLTVCWGSAWPSATSTEPCTLPVTTSCGLEKQASSPNWTSTSGVRDLSGKWFCFSFLCAHLNDK